MIRNNKLYFMLVAVMFLIAAALGIAMLVKPSSQASIQPAAEPLYWHVMGDKAHMSLRANFVSKTEQTFRLDIWLPHGVGAPVQAQVKAAPENGTAGPILTDSKASTSIRTNRRKARILTLPATGS